MNVKKYMELIATSRPRFWLYLAGPALVGAAYGIDTIAGLMRIEVVLIILYFLVPANFLVYGINDIFDSKIDQKNPKKKSKETQYRGGIGLPILVISSVILGVILMSMLTMNSIPWMIGFLFLSWAYSAPPFRFKTKPILDSCSNILYIFPGVITYIVVSGSNPPWLAIIGGCFWAMAMHTFSAIPDIVPDRESKIETLATSLGQMGSIVYCGSCWLIASVLFAMVDIRLGMLLSIYLVVLGGIVLRKTEIGVAYWWYPRINAIVGFLLVIGGLLRIAT